MNAAPQDGSDWLRIAFMAVLWVIALAALLAGLFMFLYSLSQWLDAGGSFKGLDGFFDGLIGQIGAGFVSGGLLGAAGLLRFSRFAIAPTISLGIAIGGLVFVLACTWVFGSIFDPDDLGPRAGILAIAALGVITICLPPFLHWRGSRLKVAQGDVAKSAPATPDKPA